MEKNDDSLKEEKLEEQVVEEAAEEKHSTKRIWYALFFSLFFIILVLLYYVYGYNRVYMGVYLQDLPLGNQNKLEVLDSLKNEYNFYLTDKYINLTFGDLSYKLFTKDFVEGLDYDYLVNEAYMMGRKGNLIERIATIVSVHIHHKELDFVFVANEDTLREALIEIKKQVDREPLDAAMTKKPKEDFATTKEKVGIELLVDRNMESIKLSLAKLQRNKYIDMELIASTMPPAVTEADLKGIQNLLGGFSTKYAPSDVSRTTNLRVGTERINGTILKPGEVLSVHEALLPRTIANGYRIGKVIVNGELVDGIGGGICQISTTLYNAVLFSELEVVERQNHSLPVGYIPLGQDATISGAYLDFKFKNSTPKPLYIEGYLDDATAEITYKIYGDNAHVTADKIEIRHITRRVISAPMDKIVYDDALPEGSRKTTVVGKPGYVVDVYRDRYKNGELVATDHINTSNYRATQGKVLVGTRVDG